jgi:hypothetical protein
LRRADRKGSISIAGRNGFEHGPVHWPGDFRASPQLPESSALYIYLLDADDDLAAEFDVRMLVAARQLATAKVLEVEVGACDLREWFAAVADGPGLIILDGLMAIDARVGSRTPTSCSSEPTPGTRSPRRDSPCSTPSSLSVCAPGRRSRRRCCGARASEPSTLTPSGPSPASRDSSCAWSSSSGISRRVGVASSPAASTFRCRSRTACSDS